MFLHSRATQRVMTVIVLFILVFGTFVPVTYAKQLGIVGTAGVLIDSKSGQILYEKNADKIMFPASTTKVLTVAIALEKGKLTDKVKVSKNAASQEGSSIYLTEGEVLTMEELVYAILLNSGNDAAVAVAEHIAGSVPNFVKLMNAKAKEWGATDSNFCNPNGLPNDQHYTTAHDLAMIAKHAMQIPMFREIVGTKVKDINRVNPQTLKRLINHNKLLWRYDGANGIKTGYTVSAQQCLVSSAKRGDQEFIAVVLGSVGNNIWSDSSALLDYGFANFETSLIIPKGKMVNEVTVTGGTKSVQLITDEEKYFTQKIGDNKVPTQKIEIFKGLTAPVKKGQNLGYIKYAIDGKELGRVDLVADNDVNKKIIVKRHPWILPTVGLVLFLGLGIIMNRKRVSRRRRYQGMSYYRGPIR